MRLVETTDGKEVAFGEPEMGGVVVFDDELDYRGRVDCFAFVEAACEELEGEKEKD